ncbi:MAG TPA: peptidoglycan DD-metalloendopeptidase family protein [Bacteroidales bacterium]|nr:peptidoglycan DD-metalloendopeptidase family protein [Bacteroidales bacterium]HNS45950.1 peptidoglycan DD-metalloendopeptidase family protein [Bacteroidales bacterium]
MKRVIHMTHSHRFSAILILVSGWVLLVAGGMFSAVYAQVEEKENLQQKKSEIEKEIEYTNKLLEETRKSKQSSLGELAVINRKINRREALIQTINNEISLLDGQIHQNQAALEALNAELTGLKDEYARMIYCAFKNRRAYDRLMFLFSARSFNQAYQRMKYLQQYSDYRRQQAVLIVKKQEELNEATQQVEQLKEEKLSLLTSKERELANLDIEKKNKDSTVSGLGQKEAELRKTLKSKELAAKKLQQAIEKIIAEEIRKSNELANKKTSAAGATFALTPEERELSSTFEANKGKLPWPTERGVLSSSFGEHAHPDLKGIKVKNNGIDILTNAGSAARAVFSGEVSRIISIPKYGNVVIIRHGEYLSVYSNLDEVMVKKGDRVVTRQVVGSIKTDEVLIRTELHFELWKGKETQDPMLWIAR